ncbi:MAG TPA: hypothetical protein VGQ83_12840 [Polyangia bacterium]
MLLRLAVVAGVVLAAVPASASVIVQLDVPTLAARADGIVRGRVVDQRARWDAQHTRIFTDVRVAVDQVYKGPGAPGDVIVVTRLGGSVDGVGMKVAGEAAFVLGEEALVFLRRQAAGGRLYHTVLGMAQGKLTVVRGPRGAQVVQSAALAGLRLVAPGPGRRVRPAAPPPAVRPLADVERAIRAALPRRPAVPR